MKSKRRGGRIRGLSEMACPVWGAQFSVPANDVAYIPLVYLPPSQSNTPSPLGGIEVHGIECWADVFPPFNLPFPLNQNISVPAVGIYKATWDIDKTGGPGFGDLDPNTANNAASDQWLAIKARTLAYSTTPAGNLNLVQPLFHIRVNRQVVVKSGMGIILALSNYSTSFSGLTFCPYVRLRYTHVV